MQVGLASISRDLICADHSLRWGALEVEGSTYAVTCTRIRCVVEDFVDSLRAVALQHCLSSLIYCSLFFPIYLSISYSFAVGVLLYLSVRVYPSYSLFFLKIIISHF